MDYVADGLIDGRTLRVLAIVDDYSRECLAFEVDTSLPRARVVAVLETHSAVAWGDERSAAYGRDPERDQAGVFQRIGANRWRLVLPWPKQESTLDILELAR